MMEQWRSRAFPVWKYRPRFRPSVKWPGALFPYFLVPIDDWFLLPETAGNYVVCRFDNEHYYSVYAGQAKHLRSRFRNHHKMPCFKQQGATHISYNPNGMQEIFRRNVEEAIIQAHAPPCNSQ